MAAVPLLGQRGSFSDYRVTRSVARMAGTWASVTGEKWLDEGFEGDYPPT